MNRTVMSEAEVRLPHRSVEEPQLKAICEATESAGLYQSSGSTFI